MNTRDYECLECKCWFTIYNALWSECSIKCPVCQEKVKHLKPDWEGEVNLQITQQGKDLISTLAPSAKAESEQG